jgi:hypothetical protein
MEDGEVVSRALFLARCRPVAAILLLPGLFAVGGCNSSLAKHSTALSQAIAPVVSQAAAAYQGAVALNDKRNNYEAVVAYQKKDKGYNPRNAPVLLSQKDVQARLAVLAALQMYSESLVTITSGTDSKQLDAASKSVGNNLSSLGNDLAPSIETVLGIAAAPDSTTETTVTTVSGSTTTTISSTASSTALLSPGIRNGISTGINALGQFLVYRTVEKELPSKIEEMEPTVQALCEALAGDVQTLQGIEERDYDRILNLEKQFILQDEEAGTSVNPIEHRAEIMALPELARQQREDSEKLVALRGAIVNLALTHHALAADAQGNNPETLKERLDALAAAGTNLGNFYSSLPTN